MEFCVKMKKIRPIRVAPIKKYGLGELGKKCSDLPLPLPLHTLKYEIFHFQLDK
jgi:hypothetical protein